MLELKTVTLEDKDWINRLIKLENSRSADYNFTNIFVWNDTFQQKVAEYENRLLAKIMFYGRPYYAFPIGDGDLKEAIIKLCQDARAHNRPLCLRGVTKESAELLEKSFPGKFEFAPEEKVFDYIYSLEKMATLAGKKLHSKRNHINRFMEYNDWSFEVITQDTIPECIDLCHNWAESSPGHVSARSESMALERAFDNYYSLGLEGGILRSGGDIVGFSIGEKLNSDTYVIHFEKAMGTIQGAYAMINREFSRYIMEKHPDMLYVNREDDMGLENLRKAKHSYYPEFMVEKYTAVLKN